MKTTEAHEAWLRRLQVRSLRTVFDLLPGVMFFAKDLEGRFTMANLAFAQRCGCKDEASLLGKTDSDVFPPELVAAFRATLEEVAAADIILHVRDAAHPDSAAQRADVLKVLSEMSEGPDADYSQLNSFHAAFCPSAPGCVSAAGLLRNASRARPRRPAFWFSRNVSNIASSTGITPSSVSVK